MVILTVKKTDQYDSEDASVSSEELQVKGNIDEKISKLFKYTNIGGGPTDGLLSTNGKIIENPDDVSFHRLLVKNNQKFSLTTSAEGGPGEVK